MCVYSLNFDLFLMHYNLYPEQQIKSVSIGYILDMIKALILKYVKQLILGKPGYF